MRIPTFIAAAVLLAGIGCSSGAGKTPAISDPTPGDPNVATVTFRATFPGSATPSLIHPDTASIALTWDATNAVTTGSATLTPASPTKTVKLPVAEYLFTANAKDSTGAVLETAGTAGKVIGGENAVVITFLNGMWLFKDGTGANQPIELATLTADGSAPLVVDGFYLYNAPGSISPAGIVDPTIASRRNGYMTTYITNDTQTPNKDTNIDVTSQFGGGSANIANLDGAGYNVTRNCADWGGNGAVACAYTSSNGMGEVGDRLIRLLGGGGDNSGSDDPGWQAVYGRLLPPFTASQNLFAFADTRVVDGTTIAGHLFEYTIKAHSVQVLDNLSPGVFGAAVTRAAQSTNDPMVDLVLTNTGDQIVVACRDGYNGNPLYVSGQLNTGDWDFHTWDCSVQPCVQTTQTCGVDIDGDGTDDYYTCGNLSGSNPGACHRGLVPADVNDIGEYCDWYDSSTNTCSQRLPTSGVFNPWSFRDLNGDGYVDTGSFYFKHRLQESSTLDAWAYPFLAKGTAVARTMSVSVQ